MSDMTRTIRISPTMDLSDVVADGDLVAFNVGPDGTQYVVIAHEPIDDCRERMSAPSFLTADLGEPQHYRVLGIVGEQIVLDVAIVGERFRIHNAQPLPRNRLLLVCSRCSFRGPDDFDKNGRIYSSQGHLVREILLGDGIQTVQTTAEGVIWTSYFDEGIFGNCGWGMSPIGASGLIAWDDSGRKLYEFTPAEGLDYMCDCYALNVASERDVWCDYYNQFPLVRIRDHRIDAVWKPNVRGSDAFAVSEQLALFCGGYKQRDNYSLLALRSSGENELVAKFELQDRAGNKLKVDRAVGRGSSLHLLQGARIYCVDISMVVDSIGV